MELQCPLCGKARRMRRVRKAKHSQFAALTFGFLALASLMAGTFFLPLLLLAPVFFVFMLYLGIGSNSFWRCLTCKSEMPCA